MIAALDAFLGADQTGTAQRRHNLLQIDLADPEPFCQLSTRLRRVRLQGQLEQGCQGEYRFHGQFHGILHGLTIGVAALIITYKTYM